MAGPYVLAGSGLQSIATPRGLKVEVLAGGRDLASGQANPRNLFHVGLLRWGNANGYASPVPIDADSQQLFLPPGMTTLGYKLGTGAQIRVTEVLGIPTDLWDRRQVVVNTRLAGYIAPLTASTSVPIYTVPAGFSLCVLRLSTRLHLAAAGTAGSFAESMVQLGSNPLLDALLWATAIGSVVTDEVSADHLVVAAGGVLQEVYSNGHSPANVYYWTQLYGFTFL